MASRFCVVFLLATLIALGFLLKHAWWLVVPVVTLALAWLSYKVAITVAATYGESIQGGFRTTSFRPLKALHLPLPADRESEQKANHDLSDFLRQGVPVNFHYEHKGVKAESAKVEAEQLTKSTD